MTPTSLKFKWHHSTPPPNLGYFHMHEYLENHKTSFLLIVCDLKIPLRNNSIRFKIKKLRTKSLTSMPFRVVSCQLKLYQRRLLEGWNYILQARASKHISRYFASSSYTQKNDPKRHKRIIIQIMIRYVNKVSSPQEKEHLEQYLSWITCRRKSNDKDTQNLQTKITLNNMALLLTIFIFIFSKFKHIIYIYSLKAFQIIIRNF